MSQIPFLSHDQNLLDRNFFSQAQPSEVDAGRNELSTSVAPVPIDETGACFDRPRKQRANQASGGIVDLDPGVSSTWYRVLERR